MSKPIYWSAAERYAAERADERAAALDDGQDAARWQFYAAHRFERIEGIELFMWLAAVVGVRCGSLQTTQQSTSRACT